MKKEYLVFKDSKLLNITYGFFTKNGGLSKGNYSSLNCNLNSDDNKSIVKTNIKIAKKRLNLDKTNLKFINQMHSNKVELIDKKNFYKNLKVDGSITQDKNISLAVLTADCCPIFIYDINSTFICCLHSGWKGCLSNIIEAAIKKIHIIQPNKNKIFAIIGPCLNKKNFEVSNDFKKQFLLANKYYEQFFSYKKNSNIINFDMSSLIKFQLKENMIKNIKNFNLDTYENKDLFYSHRRATHNNKLQSGRMINIIGFKNKISQ